jgi:hypothetical protein
VWRCQTHLALTPARRRCVQGGCARACGWLQPPWSLVVPVGVLPRRPLQQRQQGGLVTPSEAQPSRPEDPASRGRLRLSGGEQAVGRRPRRGGGALEDTYYNCNSNRQILQFTELWHFLFVTSRLVTANVSPWLHGESLCQQRLTNIQYSRYVHETMTLPPCCMADSQI